MADPFVTALATLHNSVGAVAAEYRPVSGAPQQIRVIVDRRTSDADAGTTGVRLPAALIQVRTADVAAVAYGDQIVAGGVIYEVLEEMPPPALDAEGLTWTIEAPPVG